MSQEYTVREVLAVNDAQFGKKRIAFKTEETGERSLSTFTQYPESLQAGRKVYGDINEKTVNGRTFYNFSFAKKEETQREAHLSPEGTLQEVKNALVIKVIPLLEKIWTKVSEKQQNYYSEE